MKTKKHTSPTCAAATAEGTSLPYRAAARLMCWAVAIASTLIAIAVLQACGPKKGILEVTTEPAVARVYLDGEEVGTSPYENTEVEAGGHTVTVELKGYKKAERNVEMKAGGTVYVVIVLEKERGSLKINTEPVGAHVFIDGNRVGKSPYALGEIETGEHEIKVGIEGYKTAVSQVTVDSGKQTVLNLILEPGRMKWKYKSAGIPSSIPVAKKGMVFFSDSEGNIIAVNAETGQERWTYSTGSEDPVIPEVYDEVVLFRIPVLAPGGVGVDHYDVRALDIETGRERWKREMGIRNSNVERETICYQSAYDTVTAVNIRTGEEKWEYRMHDFSLGAIKLDRRWVYLRDALYKFIAVNLQTGKGRMRYDAGVKVYSSGRDFGGLVFLGGLDGYFYALDGSTLRKLWQHKTGVRPQEYQPAGFRPAVHNGVVYFPSLDGNMYAVDIKTGEEKWHYNAGGDRFAYNSPRIHGGVVYFVFNFGLIFALDADTGAPKWNTQTGSYASSPEAHGEVVYTMDSSRNIYVIDAESGAVRWKLKPKEGKYHPHSIHDGMVFFGDPDGYFHIADIETGDTLLKFKLQAKVTLPAAVYDGIAYFGSEEGYLYALQVKGLRRTVPRKIVRFPESP